MIHPKLRRTGEFVNYKRVERLYALETLHIRRRRRKKTPWLIDSRCCVPGLPTRCGPWILRLIRWPRTERSSD